ncbi:MAG: ABC transporter ATP-binding protein/permease [Treponema sp.]|jgi:ATP-binding cassette subfamily B protein|nr:ABC transporter ATP-binding protein/permease [Treponema sp.]
MIAQSAEAGAERGARRKEYHFIARYVRPCLSRMSLGLAIKFLGTVADLFLPWILAYMIDEVVPRRRIPLILGWGGVMVFCSAVAVSFNIAANRMSAAVARDITRVIRHDLFSKASCLSCAQIDRVTVPSLIARLSSDTYNIHRLLSGMQRMGVRAPILLLGGILMTFSLDPVLTLVMAGMLPFTLLVVYLVSRRGVPLYTSLQEAVDTMVRVVRENSAGIKIVKALSKTDDERRRFARANEEMTRRERKANIIMGITNPAMFLFLNLGLVAVIIVGAYRVNAAQTQAGVILAFLTYFTIILNATLSITRMFVMYSRGRASADRIAEILALPEDLRLGQRDHVDSGFHISFEDVSFSYTANPEQRPLLEGISFALKRGETLGILGETGSGKSTVLQLLLRFYDAAGGRIRVNGDDIRGIPPGEFYRLFGVAMQKDVLFADTIRENVGFGRDLSEDELRRALRFAQAEQFVDDMAQGPDTPLSSRGANLSGGQRQRLLIGRALATCPEILILDDSSSALDYRTDAELRRALRDHFAGTTTIIVAQRVSSVMQADRIMVLERGRIIGYGTHRELLAGCALYREICESQMGAAEAGGAGGARV